MIFFNFIQLFAQPVINKELIELRKQFDVNQNKFDWHYQNYKNLQNHKDPVFQGYAGMSSFMLANLSIDPFSKWHYFQKGKKILEQSLEKKTDSAELRFLRLVVQSKIPSFLGYSSHINEDKNWLLKNMLIIQQTDADLYKRIYEFFKENQWI